MSRVKLKRPSGRLTPTEKALQGWLMDFANWLNNWQEGAGHYTTRSDSSLNSYLVTIKDDEGTFSAAEWLKWAVFGRTSGKPPPPDLIRQWIEDKPISIPPEMSINQLAFLISRKIGQSGTRPPKLRRQNIALVLDNFSRKHLNTLGDDLAEQTADNVMRQFDRIK